MISRVKHRITFGLLLTYLALVIISLVAIFPLLFTLSSSLKQPADLMGNPSGLIPMRPTLHYYVKLLTVFSMLIYLKNSMIVTLLTVMISIVLSSFAAYSAVRFYPRFGRKIIYALIFTYMFPHYVLAIPFYFTMSRLHLINTFLGLTIAYLSFTIPFSMYVLIGFFQSVPIEIEQASTIDGASRFQTFSLIAVPLTAGGIVATAAFAFINAWNEFLYALILVGTGKRQTVAVALYSVYGGEVYDWGGMLAACVIVIIPSLLFFFLVQKWIGAGMTAGAVKG